MNGPQLGGRNLGLQFLKKSSIFFLEVFQKKLVTMRSARFCYVCVCIGGGGGLV